MSAFHFETNPYGLIKYDRGEMCMYLSFFFLKKKAVVI